MQNDFHRCFKTVSTKQSHSFERKMVELGGPASTEKLKTLKEGCGGKRGMSKVGVASGLLLWT